jgi:hypothetical protein
MTLLLRVSWATCTFLKSVASMNGPFFNDLAIASPDESVSTETGDGVK